MIHRMLIRSLIPIAAALVAIGSAGRVDAEIVYFVSRTDGGLYTFNTTGGGISALPSAGAGTFSSPTALALGPDGNLYVGDDTGGGSIRRYSMATGSVSSVVTLSGTNPVFGGGAVSPTAIAFTPGGSMLVGRNPEKGATVVGYPSGQVIEVIGWNGGSPTVQHYTSGGSPNYQTGLAVAPDGTLYASNTTYDILVLPFPPLIGNVVKFNGSGGYQSAVAADGTGTGGLSGPTGLGLFGNSLYIASAMNGKVYRNDLTNPDTSTNTIEFASTGGDYLGPLAMLSDGGLLVGSVSGATGLIYRFGASGNLLGTFGGASYGQIGGIVAVPEPGAMLLVAAAGVVLCLRRVRGRLRRS